MSNAWADFLSARLKLIHEWAATGIPGSGDATPGAIAAELNRHDAGQIQLLIATRPDKPMPASVYQELEQLRDAADKACEVWETYPNRSVHEIRTAMRKLRAEIGGDR